MKKQTTAATTENIYPNVFELLNSGDDVTMNDVIDEMKSAGLSENDLPDMESALIAICK